MPRLVKLSLTLCVALTFCARDAVAEDPPRQDDKDAAFYVLFKTAGRTWVHKRVPKAGNPGGDVDTSYNVHEVVNVYAGYAEYRDRTQAKPTVEPAGGLESWKVAFDKKAPMFRDPPAAKKAAAEKLKVGAGTFNCQKWVDSFGGATWMSADFPGLMVKSDDPYGTRELVTFDRIEGDPADAADKAKPRKPRAKEEKDSPKEQDEKRLFTKRGRKWFVNISIVTGPDDKRSRRFDMKQYEVAATSATEATLEITRVTQAREKIKGEEPQKLAIKFDRFAEYQQPTELCREDRTERRKVAGGLYHCKVYTFRDAEKREGSAWYANEWPGLMIRRTINADKYEETWELVEFNE